MVIRKLGAALPGVNGGLEIRPARAKTRPRAPGRLSARKVHERPAPTPDLPASAALRSSGGLDILHAYACGGRPSRASQPWALRRLATGFTSRPGEDPGVVRSRTGF